MGTQLVEEHLYRVWELPAVIIVTKFVYVYRLFSSGFTVSGDKGVLLPPEARASFALDLFPAFKGTEGRIRVSFLRRQLLKQLQFKIMSVTLWLMLG